MAPTSGSDLNSATSGGESSSSLPFATLIHMMTIKLNSSNYLLWKSQITPILESQDLMKFLEDQTITASSQTDRQLRMLLHSSLSEEAMAVVVGCTTARSSWEALKSTFSHASESRELSLRSDLQQLSKGASSVQEYARKFKKICDELASIGKPVNESFQSQWFLRGLGTDFSTFSTAQMAVTPFPRFTDLIHRAEAHEIFQKSISTTASAPAAFTANTSGRSSYRGSSNRLGGQPDYRNSGRRGRGGRRTYVPRCQLCDRTGHKATQCREYTLQHRTNPPHANLAEAFNASSSVANSDISDWFLDSGASAHMTPSASTIDTPAPYHESSGRHNPGNRDK